MEERNFNEVLKSIMDFGNESLNAKLLLAAPHWSKRYRWGRLQRYVSKYVPRSSSNEKSVKIYAALYDCSEKQIKEQFEMEGCY